MVNADTKQIESSLSSLKKKISQLNKNIEDLLALNNQIAKKSMIVDRIHSEKVHQSKIKSENDRDAKQTLIR